jgi:hypothetical protein
VVQCSISKDDAKPLPSRNTHRDCVYLPGAFVALCEDRATRCIRGNDMLVGRIDTVGVRCARTDHPATERVSVFKQGTGSAHRSAERAASRLRP